MKWLFLQGNCQIWWRKCDFFGVPGMIFNLKYSRPISVAFSREIFSFCRSKVKTSVSPSEVEVATATAAAGTTTEGRLLSATTGQ